MWNAPPLFLQLINPFLKKGELECLVAVYLVFRVALEHLVHLLLRYEFGPWSLLVKFVAFHDLVVAVLLYFNHFFQRQLQKIRWISNTQLMKALIADSLIINMFANLGKRHQ